MKVPDYGGRTKNIHREELFEGNDERAIKYNEIIR